MAEPIGTLPESMVERPKYQTPGAILRRLDPACIPPTEVGPSGSGDRQDKSSLDPTGQPNTKGTIRPAGVTHLQVTPARRSLDLDPGDGQLRVDDDQIPDPATGDPLALLNSTAELGMFFEAQDPERARDPVDLKESADGQRKQVVDSHREKDQIPDPTDSLDPRPEASTAVEQVCYHESGDLHAEDVAAEMAVLPEVTSTTEEVTIDDIQVGDPDINTPEEIERLRRRIWRCRHLLIGKGNALPPAARGVVCDIDVGNAKPIAQSVRKVAPQIRGKVVGPDQRIARSQDHQRLNISMSIPNRGDH
ncbi:unnamed protein product [Phytophthora fragariaefolia]|uniref:Unnamed protein product n=1 Tax=Phytophthora fragariaefolia TaxID=1490495 RepID=A0A9W7CV33_9STRA|nr:unnamed protein product [Phytophthora fragariaefolia]